VQQALDLAAALDTSVYDVTIQLAKSYYDTAGMLLKSAAGSGSITVIGDETTPSNVQVCISSGTNLFDATNQTMTFRLKGMQTIATGGGTKRVILSSRAYVTFKNLDISTGFSVQLRAADTGILEFTGNYTISGGASIHWQVVSGIIRGQGFTITLTGTPAFSTAFAQGLYAGVQNVQANTFSGAATGTRYSITMNSVCNVGGGGANYFPGNAAGSTATGGQYA
jgi:hypothetical protein